MKKKGFTLIELLAVIVILAIIIVLAVPKVLDVIEKAEMQAYKESVELMVHTAKMQYELDDIKGEARSLPIEYIYGEDGKDTVQINENEVGLLKFKGDKPSSGSLTLLENKNVIVEKLVSKNKKWCAIKNENEKGVKVGRSTDNGFKCVIEEEIVKDKKPCELEEDKDKVTLYVDSVSDLYRLSRDVNNGTSYEGKVIKLRNDLDMSDNKNTCGEESFKPIGTAENQFIGTFDGGAKTISNLTINLPNDDNVGLFGHMSAGEIVGLNLENINVTGKDNVGGLLGYSGNDPMIREIVLNKSNIIGNTYVGGLIGNMYNGNTSNIVVEANVTGNSIIGMVYGSAWYENGGYDQSRIVKSGKITANSEVSIFGGYRTNGYYSNKVVVNEENKIDGFKYETDLNDINFYEAAGLDTWIGGDNNSTGYYFDYDDKGEIILKSVEKDPMNFNLKGSGTKENPYLIKNETDWKTATLQLNKENYYKITNNLNFSNNKFYMFGSYNNSLIGTLDGGAKTISNVTIHASETGNIGIVGHMTQGEIVGLNLENLNIMGKDNVGGLLGYSGNAPTIQEIALKKSNIYGNQNVGGLIGDMYNGNTSNIVIEANVTGNSTIGMVYGTAWYENGGYNPSRIVEDGEITGTSGTSMFGGYRTVGYYSNKVVINGIPQTDGFSSDNIGNLEFYTDKVETKNNGDVNNTGYYFDYVDSKKGIYVVEK